MDDIKIEKIQKIIIKNMEELNLIARKQDILIIETKSYIKLLIELLNKNEELQCENEINLAELKDNGKTYDVDKVFDDL